MYNSIMYNNNYSNGYSKVIFPSKWRESLPEKLSNSIMTTTYAQWTTRSGINKLVFITRVCVVCVVHSIPLC